MSKKKADSPFHLSFNNPHLAQPMRIYPLLQSCGLEEHEQEPLACRDYRIRQDEMRQLNPQNNSCVVIPKEFLTSHHPPLPPEHCYSLLGQTDLQEATFSVTPTEYGAVLLWQLNRNNIRGRGSVVFEAATYLLHWPI